MHAPFSGTTPLASAPSCSLIGKKRRDLICCYGWTEEITLRLIAPAPVQAICLASCFDPFGDRRDSQIPSEVDDRADDRRVDRIVEGLNKRTINLEYINRKLL